MGQAKQKDTTVVGIVEAIDELIALRVAEATSPPIFGYHHEQEAELIKRRIRDGLRAHSGAKGIYVKGEHD